MPVRVLQETMDSREFSEWMAEVKLRQRDHERESMKAEASARTARAMR